jgi:hypothetical protein
MRIPREEVLGRLQSIRGVGPYTAGIIESHAFRRSDAVGLDSWNRKILAKALLAKADTPAAVLLAKLKRLFPSYEGTALMYIVENEFVDHPVVSLVGNESADPRARRQRTGGMRKHPLQLLESVR